MSSDWLIAAGVVMTVLWSIYREASLKTFKLAYLDYQKQSIADNQEMIRHVTQCLADVTSTLGSTVRAVDSSTGITKEIKSELLTHFNQTETRIMAMLQRIEQTAVHIHNVQASIAGNSQNHFKGN
jgi:hypothetical protein